MSKVSNCCSDSGTKIYHPAGNDVNYKDVEICAKCGEFCEYIEDDPIIDGNDLTADESRGAFRDMQIENQKYK